MSDYYTNSADISPEALGIFAGIFMFVMFIVLIFYWINIIFQWKVFVKAGKPGWAALIPIIKCVYISKIIY